ncbi:MAG TPA: hypothetical protein VLW85_19450, partial [Myxococcales bacterium]|nr:hypothetical protein [Myxococcales bacterium]
RLFLILLLAYGWLFVFFPRINNPNELVRIYAARALVEDHTWSIGRRTRAGDRGPVYDSWGYVNDKALVCDDPRLQPPACEGPLYAAKAPGPTVLAVPVIWLLERFEKPLSKDAAVLALRWVWMIVPTILFWLAMHRFLDSAPVVLAGALGSLSLTYGQMFAGHQLAALALGAAYLCGFWKCRPVLVGFFAAAAVAMEYPSAPAAALICLAYAWRNPRWLRGVLLGALPWAAVVLQFHWSAFGAPWSTPYSHLENPGFVRDIAPGFMGISLPTPERVYGSLFAPWLGLLFWAPWIVLALKPRKTLPFALVAYYLVFQITHALWRSGWVVGPRYITPIVPFAAICAAQLLRERPRLQPLFRGLAAAGVAATGLASAVCLGFPLEVQNPLREVVWPLLAHGFVPRNPLQLAGVPGLWSALPYFAALAAAIAFLLRRDLVAIAMAAAIAAVQWAAPATSDRGAAHFFESTWEPNPPPGAAPF